MKSYEQPHIIGDGPKHDADMSIIGSFVKSKYSGDYLDKLSVHTYYVSQLLNYWTDLKAKILRGEASFQMNRSYNLSGSVVIDKATDSLSRSLIEKRLAKRKEIYGAENVEKMQQFATGGNSRYTNLEEEMQSQFPLPYVTIDLPSSHTSFKHPPIEEDFLLEIMTAYPKEQARFIKNKLDRYETRLMALLENLQNKFKAEKELDTIEIENLFAYISALACGKSKTEFLVFQSRPFNRSTYPLPNNFGLFGLNSFLYAFVNKIYLVGIPEDEAFYDGMSGCPIQFIHHDYSHVTNFDLENTDYEIYYYNIFNRGFDVKMKELLVLVLWIIVHEINVDLMKYDPIIYFETIKSAYENQLPYATEFYEDVLSFSDIISDENVHNVIINIFPMATEIISGSALYYFIMVMIYGYIVLRQFLN